MLVWKVGKCIQSLIHFAALSLRKRTEYFSLFPRRQFKKLLEAIANPLTLGGRKRAPRGQLLFQPLTLRLWQVARNACLLAGGSRLELLDKANRPFIVPDLG